MLNHSFMYPSCRSRRKKMENEWEKMDKNNPRTLFSSFPTFFLYLPDLQISNAQIWTIFFAVLLKLFIIFSAAFVDLPRHRPNQQSRNDQIGYPQVPRDIWRCYLLNYGLICLVSWYPAASESGFHVVRNYNKHHFDHRWERIFGILCVCFVCLELELRRARSNGELWRYFILKGSTEALSSLVSSHQTTSTTLTLIHSNHPPHQTANKPTIKFAIWIGNPTSCIYSRNSFYVVRKTRTWKSLRIRV